MQNLKSIIKGNGLFYTAAVLSFIILSIIVFLFPLEFSSYRNSDKLAPFWYGVTLSGGTYGAVIIFLSLMTYLWFHFKNSKKQLQSVFIFLGVIVCIQILLSVSTLYLFKDYFRTPRPSQLYITEKGFSGRSTQEFFTMPPEEKNRFLRETIGENRIEFEDIYPPILENWASESGYAFPSGHSQTAFFLGTIISFILFKIHTGRYYFIIPLVWAILVAVSRVITGVHFSVDVAAGAFTGLVIALIIVSVKKFRVLFD